MINAHSNIHNPREHRDRGWGHHICPATISQLSRTVASPTIHPASLQRTRVVTASTDLDCASHDRGSRNGRHAQASCGVSIPQSQLTVVVVAPAVHAASSGERACVGLACRNGDHT